MADGPERRCRSCSFSKHERRPPWSASESTWGPLLGARRGRAGRLPGDAGIAQPDTRAKIPLSTAGEARVSPAPSGRWTDPSYLHRAHRPCSRGRARGSRCRRACLNQPLSRSLAPALTREALHGRHNHLSRGVRQLDSSSASPTPCSGMNFACLPLGDGPCSAVPGSPRFSRAGLGHFDHRASRRGLAASTL